MSTLPMPIKVKPYHHQQAAFEFACREFGLLSPINHRARGLALLMEMGCGKSLTGIAISGILYQFGEVNRVLVVAPLSILGVWQEEYEKFAAFPYELIILKGSCAKKKEQISNIQMKQGVMQVVVVNYESAWRMEKELLAYSPDLIIADEGHKLKENRTSQSKAMHNLGDHAGYKLLLTGTVITGKELDVFSQYRFLDKSIFGISFYQFRNRYFDMLGYGNHTPVFRKMMSDEFLKKMHSVAFRCTKEECLDLPEITEEIRHIELEDKCQKLYEQIKKESFAELTDSEVTAPNVLTKLLRLSQLTGGFITDDAGKCTQMSTAKLDSLSDVVDSVIEDNNKIVIIARFVAEMDAIQAMLEKKHLNYAVVRGGITNRDEQIHAFQNDADCKVFVGQIAAAGLGITLTAASTMVFYSMDYSMSNFDQCKARIHRVSQTKPCHYIYLTCKNTVDVKVLRALRNKINLAKSLVDDYRKGINPFSEH